MSSSSTNTCFTTSDSSNSSASQYEYSFVNARAHKLLMSSISSSSFSLNSASNANNSTDKNQHHVVLAPNHELAQTQQRLYEQNGNSYQQALYTQFQSSSSNTNNNLCQSSVSSLNSTTSTTHASSHQNIYNIFIPFGYDKQYVQLYGIYGYRLQECDKNYARLMLVKIIHEYIEKYNNLPRDNETSDCNKGIVLVYFTSGESAMLQKQNSQKNKNNKKQKKQKKQMDFMYFKSQILKNLEIKYLQYIKNVYVVHQSFLSKPLLPFSLSLGSKNKLHNQIIQSLVKYVDNLESLVNTLGPLFQCEYIKEQVQVYNNSVKFLDIFTAIDRKQAKRKMIQQLGQDLTDDEIRRQLYKSKINDYVLQYETGIPILLNALLTTLQTTTAISMLATCTSSKNSNKNLQNQGIFRKACSQDKLRQLQKQLKQCIMQQQMVRVSQKYDAHTVACCVKTIFNKLNPPIISYDSYQKLIIKMDAMYLKNKKQISENNSINNNGINRVTKQQKQNTNEGIKCEKPVYDQHGNIDKNKQLVSQLNQTSVISSSQSQKCQLTKQNIDELIAFLSYFIGSNERSILLRLIRFFRNSVIPNEKFNKMSAYNLSVVMGPCIFRPRRYNINDLINSPRHANLLYHLILEPIKLQ